MCCCGCRYECCCDHYRGHNWHHEALHTHVHRRFISKKERVEVLKEYAESLRNELAGVEDEIRELEK